MAVCGAEPLGLGLEPLPRSSPVDSTALLEPLNAEFETLKLNVKPEDQIEEKPDGGIRDTAAADEIEDPADGNLAPSAEEKAPEPSTEVKADGWGWDEDVAAPEEDDKLEKQQESYDGEIWGWNQQATNATEEESVSAGKGLEASNDDRTQRKKFPFVSRSGVPECTFYMKTGTCKFGLNCKFNHPPARPRNKVRFRKAPDSGQAVELDKNETSSETNVQPEQEVASKEKKNSTFSESNGKMDCKFYTMPGGCKFGSSCRYKHKEQLEAPAELNFLGLPNRPGVKECSYYMSTGSCKYSTNCRFHHPDPIAVSGQDSSSSSSGYQNVGSPQSHAHPAQLPMTSWPLPQTQNEPVPFIDAPPPYVTGFFLPPQGLHPNPEWNGYQAPVNPLFPAKMSMPRTPSASTMQDAARKGSGFTLKQAVDGEYPERPGQPECQFFMKTGSCKFKLACRYHHPKSRLPRTSEVNISPVGLPLRPDQPVCSHYSRHGICKYGRACRYSHPIDCNPSASLPPATESSRKVYPESNFGSQGVVTGSGTVPIQESAW